MNQMKVCKLVRLLKKDAAGEYVNEKNTVTVLRKRVVVDIDSVEESEANYKTSGLLYIVDEGETKKRNAIVEAESNTQNDEVVDKDAVPPAPKSPEKPAENKPVDGKVVADKPDAIL